MSYEDPADIEENSSSDGESGYEIPDVDGERNGSSNFRDRFKIVILILCTLTFALGIWWTLIMFIPLGGINDVLAMGIAQFSGFLVFLYLLTTYLFIKVIPITRGFLDKRKERMNEKNSSESRERKTSLKNLILAIGILLVFLNCLPILSTPVSIQNAEEEFTDAYGTDWRERIPDDVEAYFMASQFNLWNYYLGIPQRDCQVETDILYYQDSEVELNFDVYYPNPSDQELPGKNSIIIKIHGGGWTQGDKGLGNMLWVNKYLASQGYIVFDIQYGLYDTGESTYLPTPESVRGDVTLHDMIRQIGNFTFLLEEEYASTYDANLDSVFVMGGSAGGHLTGVFGLGYNDPYFAGNFSNALTIKGIVPYYPANFAERYFTGARDDLIPGDPDGNELAYEKFTPSELADKNDPAALIFQGLQDGMVPPENSITIENALEEEGVNALLLTFPCAAHANDYVASNNFAQVFLYYLERFLYLEQ